MTPHPSVRRTFQEQFVPGQYASATGLYHVHHGIRHRQDHDVIILRGEELPACRTCKGRVQYAIGKKTLYITDDFDFTAPAKLILPPKRPPARAKL